MTQQQQGAQPLRVDIVKEQCHETWEGKRN